MKSFIASIALVLSVAAGSVGAAYGTAHAQDKKSEPAAAQAAPAPTSTPAAAPSATAAAPAAATPAPVPNKGDVAWMLVSTALVLLMSVPALALFYGGLVRSKNMLSVLMQVFVTFSLITVLWVVYGYSLAFTEGNAYIGGFDRLFFNGIANVPKGEFAMAATFSKGVVIPEMLFAAFQCTFAAITCCLILGSVAERMKFSAVLLFVALWFTFSYAPLAHMVWFWMGPDAYTDPTLVDGLNEKAGLLWRWGALDFAGGTVVHINAGVAGLVAAYMLGKRVGYGKEALTPHSLTMTMIGASMLWFGWFGFNAGSALEAGNSAVLAFMNTFLATACAVLSWTFAEWLLKGKPSMLGAASGTVAGLVAITPAAGNVGIPGAFVIGTLAGLVCLWGVTGLKRLLKADDSLDVFGVHAVGGILGALLTGVFVSPDLGGPGFVTDWVKASTGFTSIGEQVMIQAKAVGLAVVWSGVVTAVVLFIVKMVVGLRVSEDDEREGLDIASHGETAYNK
ncbi:ammonia channel protein [Betaproteobacteria bacterium UKL13-2]|nr:ammonia channel protein [Betaproteobacteria bacterium UKL13-2]HCG52559.1 ammonia channel protein [Betaproteobacteria bacterium]